MSTTQNHESPSPELGDLGNEAPSNRAQGTTHRHEPPRGDGPRWSIVLALWVLGVFALIGGGVGALDNWASPTEVGRSLMRWGLPIGTVCVVAALALLPRRPMAGKQLIFIGVGVWPFAAFGFFLVWQIGMSKEQRAGCSAGEAHQCHVLASRRERRGHFEDAAQLFEAGCELGDLRSCHSFAAMLEGGRGVDSDLPRAATLYARACDADPPNALSCSLLGGMFAQGRGVDADLNRALSLYDRACELGNSNACAQRDLLAE